MDPRTFPTKGNLMLAKNSLALAKQGYDLMDKKRHVQFRRRSIPHLPMRISAFNAPILRMVSAMWSCSPILYRSKIPSRFRRGA